MNGDGIAAIVEVRVRFRREHNFAREIACNELHTAERNTVGRRHARAADAHHSDDTARKRCCRRRTA